MKPLLFFVLLVVPFSLAAQNRTNVWELSYKFGIAPKCEMRYINGSMDTGTVYRVMSFFITNGSICDTNGNLLFYTNGLTIGNRNYDTMKNAVDFNPGSQSVSDEPLGLGTCQGVLILPDPGHEHRYYVFHESGEDFTAYNTYEVQPLHLSYSVVDMDLDGGLGGIVDSLKNKYAIVDTLLHGGLTAVKHANGRDWWIIFHNFYRDTFYKLLLTPSGIDSVYEQTIGSDLMYDVNVQATFSPMVQNTALPTKVVGLTICNLIGALVNFLFVKLLLLLIPSVCLAVHFLRIIGFCMFHPGIIYFNTILGTAI